MTTRGVINSNFYQIVNVDVDGNPTDVKPEYIIASNNANYANYAGNAFSVDVGNVVGIGNIATINLDGDSSNILYGNGVFSAAPNVSNANSANFANYANFAGNAYSVDVGNVVGIGNIATINLDGNSGNILYGNGVFSAVPDVGNANSANFANYANFAGNAYSVDVGNVVGIGNIATINLDSNSSNILFGNGVFSAIPNVANANYANYVGQVIDATQSNITSVGTLTGLTVSGAGSFGANVNMNTHWINNVGYPSANSDAATKEYVDILASTGISFHEAVNAATNTTLAIATSGTTAYVEPNGAGNGIGSYISTTGTFTTIDTQNIAVANSRILVKNESNASWNGIYNYTNATAITRSSDADTYGINNDLKLGLNDYFFTTGGNVNKGTAFIVNEPVGTITFGTSNIGFAVFSTGLVYTGGVGINVSGTVINISNTTVSNGTYGNGDNVATFTVNDQGQLTAASNTVITANAANLTGTTLNANIVNSNLTSVGTLTTLDVTGNISTSNYFIGNGAFLTGISGVYSNSNVANYLPTFTGNLSAGNATLGNLTTSNYFSGTLGSGNTYIQIPSVTSGNMNFVANGVSTMSLIGSNVNVSGNVNTIGMFATGNISSGNATLGNLTTSNYFSGNGYLLTGVTSASANTANTVTNNNQPNITSVGTLTTLAVSGNVTASTLISNVATGTAPLVVTSTTVVANLNVAQANIATNIVPLADTSNATNQQVYFGATANGQVKYDPSFYYNSSSNALNVGNSITFGANITGPRFISNIATGTAPFTVTSTTTVANLSVANATYANTTGSATTAGTVTTNSQPNITSVGTLTSLSVTGNITSGNANLGNLTTSNYFSGHGYLLTGVTAGSANTAITVTGNAQPNITSVGALSNLTVSGNINSNNIVVGNLVTANSFFATTQSTATTPGGSLSLTYLSPQNQRFTGSSIFDVVLPDPSTLTTGAVWYLNNDSTNNIIVKNFAGTTLYTVLPGANTKFIYTGSSNWDYHSYLPNSMSASSTTANLANLVIANYFSGNGSLLTGITTSGGNANYANFAGQVIDATQSNITSVGNLTSLTVNGNITGSNNIALYGNGGALTANISVTNYYTTTTNAFNFGFAQSRGTRTSPANVIVGDDIFAFTTAVYTGNGTATWDGTTGWKTIFPIRSTITSQPTGSNVWYGSNIRFTTSNTVGNTTYVSTFDDGGNFTVPSSVISSNANLGNLTTSNYFTGNGSLLTSITGANVTGQVGNALIAGTVYTNSQPNITSVGTLTGLTSNGVIDFTNTSNVTLGAVGNIHISGGTNGYVLQTDGAANLSWVAQSGGGGGGGTDFVPSFLLGGM